MATHPRQFRHILYVFKMNIDKTEVKEQYYHAKQPNHKRPIGRFFKVLVKVTDYKNINLTDKKILQRILN